MVDPGGADSGAPRLAVAVGPRLFADALARSLRQGGIDATAVGEGAGEAAFDIAVVADGSVEVRAPVVLRVIDGTEGSAAPGAAGDERAPSVIDVRDHADIVAAVQRWRQGVAAGG